MAARGQALVAVTAAQAYARLGASAGVVACAAKMQVSILMVRALANVVERGGASRERFLSACGVDEQTLAEGTARLPVVQYLRCMDAALEVSGDPAFGLHMGEQTRSGMFDVMGPLTEHADTLRQSVEAMIRYSRLFAEGHDPELHEHDDDTASIRFPMLRGDFTSVRMIAEFAMVSLLRPLQQFAGDQARPSRVSFAYPAPGYAAEYARIFGGVARFDQEHTELVFPRAWLDKVQAFRSPELYAVIKAQADRSLGRLERDASLRERIEGVLSKHSPRSLTMDEVAGELGMSARSLRRRLVLEELSFSELITRSRMHTAKRLLERPGASIKETAFAMGFASEAAFHRAFKRWTSMTPKQYQESF